MIVEIGHFYTNETFRPGCLSYLKKQKFREEDELHLFIDDHTAPEARDLDIPALRKEAEFVTDRKVSLSMESHMTHFFREGHDLLNQDLITHNPLNGDIFYDTRKIFRGDVMSPTCQMLSYLWSIWRIGLIGRSGGSPRDILTIIDSKYASLERRVQEMIPLEHRKRVFYRFF